jgi:hypothetical protein
VGFFFATFFCARETATQFLLLGTKKRQLQPERCVKRLFQKPLTTANFLLDKELALLVGYAETCGRLL